MTRTLIIGGGVAGMCAAVAAAERGERVTVLERGRKPLRKLGITGNGRGNLMNTGKPVYFGGASFAQDVLARVPPEKVRAFWEQLGVTLTSEDSRVYPASLRAESAVEALTLRAGKLGVELRACTQAMSACREKNGFRVKALYRTYEPERVKANGKIKKGALTDERGLDFTCDRLIVTVGGAAAPAQGTDGTGYELLTAFGHTLTPLRPALCALLTPEAPIAGLDGQRVRARLTLLSARGQTLRETEGEALFAKDGVSGIAAMQLARFIDPGCVLRMDLRPAVMGRRTWEEPLEKDAAEGDARAWLVSRITQGSALNCRELLTGAASAALSHALFLQARVADDTRPASALTDAELNRLTHALTAFTLPVLGTRGFDFAQVTAGGIATDAFDPATLQSRLTPGLFAAGEVLDVDGDCGGFNLMFAVAGALLAGQGVQGFQPRIARTNGG